MTWIKWVQYNIFHCIKNCLKSFVQCRVFLELTLIFFPFNSAVPKGKKNPLYSKIKKN